MTYFIAVLSILVLLQYLNFQCNQCLVIGILFKYLSAQALGGTEIERNHVKADSVAIFIWKSWINRLVNLVFEIPDFRFNITKKQFNHKNN